MFDDACASVYGIMTYKETTIEKEANTVCQSDKTVGIYCWKRPPRSNNSIL